MVLSKDEVYYLQGDDEYLFRVKKNIEQFLPDIDLPHTVIAFKIDLTKKMCTNMFGNKRTKELRIATVPEIRHFLACEKAQKYVEPNNVKQETDFIWY